MIPSNNRPILVKRFWAKVERSGSCWLWTGSMTGRSRNSRGQMTVNGERLLATHVSWELYRGPIPPGMHLLHKRHCNDARCVRPDHLYLGTEKDNTADAIALGRLHPRDGLPMARTTCRLGHPLDRTDKYGRRYCRICANERIRRRRKKKERI
jgi:hypothetical protein